MDPTELHPGIVAVAGDWHTNSHWARQTVRRAAQAGVQVIAHVGDFGFWPRLRGGPQYLIDLEKALAEHGITLLFLDGNHEDHETLAPFHRSSTAAMITDHIGYLPRGLRWEWFGQTWCAVGGAPSVNRPDLTEGVDWFPGEELTLRQAREIADEGPVDVLLTHDCPTGVDELDRWLATENPYADRWAQTELDRAAAHRELLGEVVDALVPKHLFHGHYHREYTGTRNAGATAVHGLDCDGSTTDANLEVLILPL